MVILASTLWLISGERHYDRGEHREYEELRSPSSERTRTRITDEQLRMLKSHFDVNNSPPEEHFKTMAGQTGLPMKVIKQWFANTPSKEQQENKDSPYNNPRTTLYLIV